jgi:hypothetical protein
VTRQLPTRPHLDHLKAQAKDLLDAHRRGEPEAFERIRASVPAFARMADDELARAAFALHDAQSAIARESDAGVDHGDEQEIAALDRRLRDAARRFVHTMPDNRVANRDHVLAFIDGTKDIGQIADVAMANLPMPVSESAAYARETQLARRLERVIAALDAALAKASAAAPPA